MNIGAHIPSKNAVEEIKQRKGDTFQIFVSSPQMWKSPKPREDVDILQRTLLQKCFLKNMVLGK